jgi:SET domain-containing protein
LTLLASQQFTDNRRLGTAGKRTYFEKSPIQGYGLFALEAICTGELICEYTGQLIRMKVADLREARSDRRGFQHTYMFRLSDTSVIDATARGSNARFLNCSCEPNCRAEIIRIKGVDRVAFFAVKSIKAHDEITFDFQMELEENPEKWQPCSCNAKRCNKYMNWSIYPDVVEERRNRANLMSEVDADT